MMSPVIGTSFNDAADTTASSGKLDVSNRMNPQYTSNVPALSPLAT